MSISIFFLIIFGCTLSLSELIGLINDEHSLNQYPVEDSIDIIKEDSKITHTEMQKMGKKDRSIWDMLRKKKKAKSTPARNCIDLKKQDKKSGIYLITPCDTSPTKIVKVYCDMDTDEGGWTVIQRRDNFTEQQDFYNPWYQYAVGFGDVSKDFWLGNDNIHCLTQQSPHEIHFDFEDFDGNTRYARYGFFYIDDRVNRYRLSIEDYSGNIGDSMARHNNQKFSTYDRDNDIDSSNCAARFKGGWWYKDCHDANLNGLYLSGHHSDWATGVNWREWKGHQYSLKKTEMKIRGSN